MEKMSRISETHPAFNRTERVKKYCGNKSMGYPLLEGGLPSLRGERKLLPVRTSITKTSALEKKKSLC